MMPVMMRKCSEIEDWNILLSANLGSQYNNSGHLCSYIIQTMAERHEAICTGKNPQRVAEYARISLNKL
jgi:hypothetical protein